jgi:uncharacterized protein (DUF169 family)
VTTATDVQTLLGLRVPPVAIAFLAAPPDGVPAWDGPEVPAGCQFWRAAQEGKTFYTVPADHYNCAVGAHTHKIPLPMERAAELDSTVGFMVEKGYIAMAEVPGIPVLPETPAVIAYAPADRAPFAPDMVIVAAPPAQAMLVYEAAVQTGVSSAQMPTLGRPGCAVLPLTLQTQAAAFSLGCRGNRTFTGLPDGELYVSIPGEKWPAVAAQLLKVHGANAAMGDYYADKKAKFAAA